MAKSRTESAGPAWERRAGESERAYASFLLYRDLGPDRSLERINQTHTKTIPVPTLKSLSSKHDWVERARAWDNHLQRERDRVASEEAAKWEKRRHAALESAWKDAERLRGRADTMLSFPLQVTEVERDGPKGKETTIIHPAKWTFWTAAQMLKMAAEIQAAVLGAVSKDPAEMTDAELRATSDEPGSG